jgi:hypothetical protein
MNMPLSANTPNMGNLNLQLQQLLSTESTKGTEGAGQPQDLKALIAALVKELTKDTGGKLDQTSPLGKAIAKEMPMGDALHTSSKHQIEQGLEALIKKLLGENPSAGQSAGGGPGGVGGAGGAGGSIQDLLTQLIQALLKNQMGNALQPDGKGGSDIAKGSEDLMSQIAKFMDANPSEFKRPDSGSWAQELTAKGGTESDSHLDGDETTQVNKAIGMLMGKIGNDSAGGDQGGLGGLGGNGGLGGGSTPTAGGDLSTGGADAKQLAYLLETLLSKLEGGEQQAGASDPQKLDRTANQAVQALMQMMQQGTGASSALS